MVSEKLKIKKFYILIIFMKNTDFRNLSLRRTYFKYCKKIFKKKRKNITKLKSDDEQRTL